MTTSNRVTPGLSSISGLGELTIELAASLAAHKVPVTPEERDELRALLEAMNMPTDPIEQLNVQG